MQPSSEEAHSALREIARAERFAARHSLNNGIITVSWGIFVFLFVTLVGIAPRFLTVERITRVADWMPPWEVATAFACLLAGPAALMALWTSVYKKRLPVQVPERGERRFWMAWGAYHAVLIAGYTLGVILARWPSSLTAWALLGFLDAAPLLYFGIHAWRRTQEGRA